MPKSTFFNLPEDKKQTLIQALKQEFSRVPVYQASIANIVKSANIPRGSFYQYFEDIEDAFFFLLNKHVEENKAKFLALLEQHQGDFFAALIELFRSIITEEEENLHFLKNVFLNLSYKIESTYTRSFFVQEKDEAFMKTIGALLAKSNGGISADGKVFEATVNILTAVTFRNLVARFARNISAEEAMANYVFEMNLLKHGLLAVKDQPAGGR